MGCAVVTGATAGIGAVFARRLAERGSDLVLVGRRRERLDALAAELTRAHGVQAEPLGADLSLAADLERVAERAAAADVSMVVNNAGINGYGSFAEVAPSTLAAVIALNVTAPVRLSRAALPGMLAREAGTIVNVASLLAFAGARPPDPLPRRATYAGTKGFIVAFTRTLAAEVADSPLRIQVLCPGYTATEFHMTNGSEPVQGTAPADQPARAMAADDVVEASLVALESGEVVCAPGVEDPKAVERLAAAEAGFLGGDRSTLAGRYRT
jgi:uncharacterized protein